MLTLSDIKGNNKAKIRKFKLEDINRILEIEGQAFPKTAFSREAFLDCADRLSDSFIVVEVGEDIAGYMIFDMGGHILSMAVKSRFRRMGIGTVMFMHALKCANKRLQLEVRSKNVGAISFYKRLGMRIAGKITDYYGTDDALVMVLNQRR